tara:strand:- start:1636 stop:2484 length:849 start_codon:yes stop_codon:yes gene_type:complete
MAVTPMQAKDLDPSKVTFGDVKVLDNGGKLVNLLHDGRTIYLQTPGLKMPFDAKFFANNGSDESSGKYSIRMQFDNMDEGSKGRIFHDKMLEFDDMVKTAAKERSVEWFKKKNMSAEVLDTIFTDSIKVYTDPETGEPNGRFPPGFTFKLKKIRGNIACQCFDPDRPKMVTVKDKKTGLPKKKRSCEEHNVNDSEREDYVKMDDLLKKGSLVKGLVKCDFVWLADAKFGCTWTAEQLEMSVPKGFNEYAFDDSDDETSAAELNTESFIESSDEEDGVARPAN